MIVGHASTSTTVRVVGGVRGTFRSLSIFNYRLFFAGQFISQVGTWTRMVAAALLVLSLTDSGLMIGVLSACQFGPVLLLGPWMGVVIDRFDTRRLLMVTQVAAVSQSVVFAFLAAIDDPPLAAIFAISVTGGVTFALESPARRAFVVDIVPPDLVQNAVGLNGAMMTSARIFGPAVAGVVATTLGYSWCFALDAVSCIAVFAALWFMDTKALHTADRVSAVRGQVTAGLRYVKGRHDLVALLVMTALVGSFAFNFQVYLPLLAMRALDGDDAAFTALFSVMSVGSCLGALSTARRHSASVETVTRAAFASGSTALLLAASPSFAVAFVAAFALGAATISFMTMTTTLVQLGTDPAMRGRVVALLSMVTVGGTPLSGPLLGFISDKIGPRSAVASVSLACLTAGLLGRIAVRRMAAYAAAVAVVTPGTSWVDQ